MSQLTDAQDILTKLKTAYANILAGTQKSKIRVGGTEFYNEFNYIAPTLADVGAEMTKWQNIVDSLQAGTQTQLQLTFTSNFSVPLLVRR